jgi:hypothetical protein
MKIINTLLPDQVMKVTLIMEVAVLVEIKVTTIKEENLQ